MLKTRKHVFLIAGLLLLAISFSVYGSGQQDQPVKSIESNMEPKYGGILKVGTSNPIPFIGYTPELNSVSFLQYLEVVFDSLTFYDEKGNIVPKLAESWETDADKATITFHLRKNVKFHDGTSFNAEAVKWNIEQYQEKKRTEVADIAKMEVIDDYTVKLFLKSWNSSVLESVGFFVYYMSPTAVKANGEDWAKNNPVGTGPFKLSQWKGDVGAEFVKNENYWKKGLPYLDGIDWNLIQDINTAAASLQSCEVDLLSLITPLQLKILDAGGMFVRETNTNGIGVTSVGVIPSSANTDSPFNNVKVRQALCYAIDRDSLVNALGFGYSQTTNQWAAAGSKTYNPDVKGYPYDPEKAKKLLAEAGYPNGFDTVIYAYAGDDYHPAVAQMLEKVGIRAKIDLVDFAKLNTMMLEGWEGLTYHWASVGPDLGLFMGRHLDPNGAFFAKGILHPQDTLDLLGKIRTAKDEESKLKYSFELQKLIYDKYALFGKVLYVASSNTMKYPYVKDDNWTIFSTASWTPELTWLDK